VYIVNVSNISFTFLQIRFKKGKGMLEKKIERMNIHYEIVIKIVNRFTEMVV